MCNEAYNERKAMLYLASRWIEVAATTGQAEAAIVGMLNEIHKQESFKALHGSRNKGLWSPEKKAKARRKTHV